MYLTYLKGITKIKGSQYFPKFFDRKLVTGLVFLNAIIGLKKWKNSTKVKEDFLGSRPVTRSNTREHITI